MHKFFFLKNQVVTVDVIFGRVIIGCLFTGWVDRNKAEGTSAMGEEEWRRSMKCSDCGEGMGQWGEVNWSIEGEEQISEVEEPRWVIEK